MVGSVISTVKPKLPKVVPNIRSFQIEQQPFYVCISLEALFYASTYHKNSTPCKKKKKNYQANLTFLFRVKYYLWAECFEKNNKMKTQV